MYEKILSAFVTNLGKYNEGELVGRWLDFPTTQKEIDKVLQEIGIDGILYEEIFITDYESDICGLTDCLGEYESLYALNFLAEKIQESVCSVDELEALLDFGVYTSSVTELITLLDSTDCFLIYSEIENDYDLGYYYVHELGMIQEIKDSVLSSYIDYEAYGRDVAQTAGDSEGCSMDDLIQESERLQNVRDKAEKRKKTILEKIKNIDLDNDLSDQIMDDYMGLVRELTEKIAQVDADIMKNELAIENMKQEVFTVEQYYRMMDAMIKNLEYQTDEHLRLLMHGFIEKIEIYPEKTNGRWVKSVQFKIGLNVDGNVCHTFGVDEENSLTYETHDETIVFIPSER